MSQAKILAYADPISRAIETSRPVPLERRFALMTTEASEPLLEAPTLTSASLTAWAMPRLWTL
jgi:hypothetical protein